MNDYFNYQSSTLLRLRSIFYLLLLFFLPAYAKYQWSTSTNTDSCLYVCPGFFPGIISYDDGSSIILGALQGFIFAQKLDPYGNKIWDQPVQVLHNDSSYITSTQLTGYQNWGGWVSDGAGGVILFWYDYREAFLDTNTGFKNNEMYAQRVDKSGMLRWGSEGIKIEGVETGSKIGAIVGDGQGGCVLAWGENEFGYPGARNISIVKTARFDSNGISRWKIDTDSTVSNCSCTFVYDVHRGGSLLYLRYVTDGNYTRVLDTTGQIISQSNPSSIGITSEGDSLVYVDKYFTNSNVNEFSLYSLNPLGDTVWTSHFDVFSSCNQTVNIVPTGSSSVYFTSTCQDTIVQIDSLGRASQIVFAGIAFGGTAYSDGNQGIVVVSSTTAKRFDRYGQMIWTSPVVFLENPNDAYFKLYAPDNNGGAIAAFWTTAGGIYAQHTGRIGRVGIITDVDGNSHSPKLFELAQNFPNPFNPKTSIRFSVPDFSKVQLKVFDVLGKEIAILCNKAFAPGSYVIEFNASNYSSGVYIVMMQADRSTPQVRKMLLLR